MKKKAKADLVRQSFWIRKETLAALNTISRNDERPVGWLVRKAVEEYVERHAESQSA